MTILDFIKEILMGGRGGGVFKIIESLPYSLLQVSVKFGRWS